MWEVLIKIAPSLRDEIEARNGKVVFRPDSGDPYHIICGYSDEEADGLELSPEEKDGCIRILDTQFGSKVNDKGYLELNPKVGLIYGDAITFERATKITNRLMEMGYASTSVVFGVGSFTYQYNTRDTFGLACKATSVVINGQRRAIEKDPITDSGEKKSAKGLLHVGQHPDGSYRLTQDVTEEMEKRGHLKVVFENGNLI